MQKVSPAKKTEQILNEEIESSIKEALKEAHFKATEVTTKFAAEPTRERMKQTGIDESRLAKDRTKDFNLIGHEQDAREAFLRNSKRERKKFFPDDKMGYLEAVRWDTYNAKIYFHSWYTGNYSKETGMITLFRYVDDFPAFDKVLKGEGGLTPRGLTGMSEEQLLEALGKGHKEVIAEIDNEERRKVKGMYADYVAGKDVSLQIYKLGFLPSFGLDPSLSWTSRDRFPSYWKAHYRIKIEVKPNEAFRIGGLDEKGDWAGEFSRECEWRTIGKVPKEAITEIVDLESGKIVYRKKQ